MEIYTLLPYMSYYIHTPCKPPLSTHLSTDVVKEHTQAIVWVLRILQLSIQQRHPALPSAMQSG